MATEGNGTLPTPPPEAVLLRLARKASRVTVAEAAGAAGISKAWLSSIENGYDNRGRGGRRPVSASDEIIARLAGFLHIPPERLESEGQRPDAAAVLREMQRPAPAPDTAPAADPLDDLDRLLAQATPQQREIFKAFARLVIEGPPQQGEQRKRA